MQLDLSATLATLGKVDEAEACCREAIRLDPEFFPAHDHLGHVLRRQGLFRESLEAHRRGYEMASKGPASPSDQLVKQAGRFVELDGRLPDIVAGKARPASLDETLAFAEMAHYRRLYSTSARLYRDALAIDHKLSLKVNDARYNAACAAALAGCGRGEDPAKPSDEERARLRKESLRWLAAELAGLGDLDGPGAAAVQAVQILRHWLTDPDLACIREEAELKKLPKAEQEGWRKLWAEHTALVNRVENRLSGGKQLELAPAPRPVSP